MAGLLDMLGRKPDITAFWQKFGPSLESLGFTREDASDIEALTNLKLIAKAMEGDMPSKKYLDEKAAAERRAKQWRTKK